MKRIITIAAIALAALLAFSCGSKSNGPEGVVKKAFEAIEKHDYDGYAATFNISESDQKMLAGMLEEKISEEIDKKGGIDNYKITDIQIDGEKATAKVHVVYKDKSEDDQTVNLVKVDDVWKQDLKK